MHLLSLVLEHRNLCLRRYIPVYVVGWFASIEGLY